MRLFLDAVYDVFSGVHDSDGVQLDSPSSLFDVLDTWLVIYIYIA